MELWQQAVLLGALEAATEFLPVSSTGHLILASHLLGFEGVGADVFKVAIQLGAVAAVCVLYLRRLWAVAAGLRRDPAARAFTLAVVVAFLPAAALGAALHGFIKGVLFDPMVVCVALVTGGVAILLAERYAPRARIRRVEEMGALTALKVGACQCLALVPGVSRSGATIIGGLLVGLERKVAAEFSFFLAIPTMLGAVVFDLLKNRAALDGGDLELIALGFATAFAVALPVVKGLVGFVSRHGFAPFAYYRIALGTLGLALLAAGWR